MSGGQDSGQQQNEIQVDDTHGPMLIILVFREIPEGGLESDLTTEFIKKIRKCQGKR
jgi:hypothetical protein